MLEFFLTKAILFDMKKWFGWFIWFFTSTLLNILSSLTRGGDFVTKPPVRFNLFVKDPFFLSNPFKRRDWL